MQRIGISSETVGEYYSEVKKVKHPLTITLYQTLSANPQIIKDFDLVIFDEEQFLSMGYANLLDDVTATRYVLGMTGTIADAARKNPKLTLALPIVFESSIAQARERNMLAPAEIIPVYVDLSPKELLEYGKLMTEYDSTRKQAYKTSDHYLQTSSHIVKQRINQLLSNTAQKIVKTVEIIESDPTAPTLVFSLSLESIEALRVTLEERRIGVRQLLMNCTTGRKDRKL